MKESKRLNPFGRFCCTIGNLPTSYMLSLTYEEQLIWFCKYLEDTVIPAVNNNAEALEELQNLFIELKDYVDNYLDNLDLQEDINNKLDEMATDGTLAEIINQEIFDELNHRTQKVGIYAPSLLNSAGSEMCTLAMGETKAVLFDVGRSTSIASNKNYLESKLGDRKINAVFISHYHGDHMGGIEGLADLYADDVVFYLPLNFIGYFNGTKENPQQAIAQRTQVLTFLNNSNITYYEVDTDRTIDFGDFTIDITGSTDEAYSYYNSVQAPTLNTYSMNCLLRFGNTKALFPGDSKIETQDYLMSKGQVEKVNIYCSPHHGYERELNTKYQKILNPDYEFFSIAPVSWNSVNLSQFDYAYRDKPKYATQAEGDVEYEMSKYASQCIKGNFVRENLFPNKVYSVYVDSNFNGVPDGTISAPYKSIPQVLSNYKETGCDLAIYLADGEYSNLRFKNLNNRISIIATNPGEVTFTDCKIWDCYDLTFNGIIFISDPSGNPNKLFTITGGNTYINSCTLQCPGTTAGNTALTSDRAIVKINNSTFTNCYTGAYANRSSLMDIVGTTFECNGYAIFGIGSYISVTEYTATSGQFRADPGCVIQTITKGNTASRPVFNNSTYMRGYCYFDANIGKPVFYYNSGGADGWILADGTVV